MKKKIDTKMNERLETVTSEQECFGKYLAENLQRTWSEDFIDEDTAEVISIERHEVIELKGTYIDNEVLPRINFHLQTGDIKEVKVSNQKRQARIVESNHLSIWNISAKYDANKKLKLLFYASSVELALKIAADYIELNYSGVFSFNKISEFEDCVLIQPPSIKEENAKQSIEEDDKKYYKIKAKVINVNQINYTSFICFATDVEDSKRQIVDLISKKLSGNEDIKDKTFEVILESATTISCDNVIPSEFSKIHFKENQES